MAKAGISVREFAKREGLTHSAIQKAIKHGRLIAHPDGSLDPALVGGPWRERAPAQTAPSAGVRNWPAPIDYDEDWRGDIPFMNRNVFNMPMLTLDLGVESDEVEAALAGVRPEGFRAGLPAWYLPTALTALGFERKAR